MTSLTLETHDAQVEGVAEGIEVDALREYQEELARSEGGLFTYEPEPFTLDGLLDEVERHGYDQGIEQGVNEAIDALQDTLERVEETIDDTMAAVADWIAELHVRFNALEDTVERLVAGDEEDEKIRTLELEFQAASVDDGLIGTALQTAAVGDLLQRLDDLPSGVRAEDVKIEVESAYWTLVTAKNKLRAWYDELEGELS